MTRNLVWISAACSIAAWLTGTYIENHERVADKRKTCQALATIEYLVPYDTLTAEDVVPALLHLDTIAKECGDVAAHRKLP
jgi:hypothetical protein